MNSLECPECGTLSHPEDPRECMKCGLPLTEQNEIPDGLQREIIREERREELSKSAYYAAKYGDGVF